MADKTKIEWTDATWNVITGCSVVSPGCKNCYAMKLAGTRLKHHPSRAGLTIEGPAGPVWNGVVRFNGHWLRQPLGWKKPRMIFVCAHGDLFHESVLDDWLYRVYAVMAIAGWHTFQVLTKRAKRMAEFTRELCTPAGFERLEAAARSLGHTLKFDGTKTVALPLPNVWHGVSVEDQTRANERIPHLMSTRSAIIWVSAEPLLGPVDLTRIMRSSQNSEWVYCDNALTGMCSTQVGQHKSRAIDWVVVGGESAYDARPMHPDWAYALLNQCTEAGTAFLYKQTGAWVSAGDPTFGTVKGRVAYIDRTGAFLDPPPQDENADCLTVVHVGKKAAGRLLAGVEHNGFPEVSR
jgi:protein gp37